MPALSPRGPFDFESAVYREIDRLADAVEKLTAQLARAVERQEERDRERDDEVSALKLQVAHLRPVVASDPPSWKRDGGLVVSTGTIVAVLTGLAQWWLTQPRPPERQPTPAPTHVTSPAEAR